MRVIIEAFGRAWGFETNVLHVKMVSPGDEEPEPLGHDPHSTLASQVERRSDLEDMYAKGSFGFRPSGSQV